MYTKVDKKRLIRINMKNKYLWDDGENIVNEINRYRMEVGTPIIQGLKERELFSQEFIDKLVNFDTDKPFEEDNLLEINEDLLDKDELFEMNKK